VNPNQPVHTGGIREIGMKIHWLQHVSFEGLGNIAGWAAEKDCPVSAPYVQTKSEIQSQPIRFETLNHEMDRLLDYFISIHRTSMTAE
jgi:hypothetical protein